MEELHNEEGHAVRDVEIENRAHIRVVNTRRYQSFVVKERQDVAVFGEIGMDDLDREDFFETQRTFDSGEVNVSHPSPGDHMGEVISPEDAAFELP